MRLALAVLAIVGLYAAQAMYRKAGLAASGRLSEPSVVELPESRLFWHVPNAAFGLAYYAIVLAAAIVDRKVGYALAAGASLLALGTSIYLAIHLIRQRLDCSRCWTAHAVNALLCPVLIAAALGKGP